MINWLKKLINIDKLASLSLDVRKHLKSSSSRYAIEFFKSNEERTPLNLYTDNDLTTLIPNPVSSDCDGKFPDIFLNEKSYFITFGIMNGAELHSRVYVNHEVVK